MIFRQEMISYVQKMYSYMSHRLAGPFAVNNAIPVMFRQTLVPSDS